MAARTLMRYKALAASTLFLNMAYLWPSYASWLIFLYLVPLFYCVLQKMRFSYFQGFVWGLLFFSIHFVALVKILLAYNSLVTALVIYSILVGYFSLYSALWFGGAELLSSCIPPIAAWISVTIVYIFFLESYSLWVFGILQGYPFAHPLIPLASYPLLLQSMCIVGRYGLLLVLLCISCGITHVLRREWGRGIVCVGIGLVPFVYGFFNQCTVNIPSYIDSCAVITPPPCSNVKLDVAQEIAYKIVHAKQIKPQIQIFFMPESCYPFALNNDQEMIDMWYQGLPDETILIIGAHRQEGKKLFNTVYCIQGSRIIHFYDKKNLFPLTEYVPHMWKKIGYNPFLTNKEPFCVGTATDKMIDVIQAYPLICCEIFFNTIYRKLQGQTIMVCVNECWFMVYMRHLMYLRSVMTALEHQVSLIWVGHTQGAFIDKSGFQLPFFTL